jgi:hypothetical protein
MKLEVAKICRWCDLWTLAGCTLLGRARVR